MAALDFQVLPSQANFIFATHKTFSAQFLYDALKENGILVRYFNTNPIDNYLRITIGTDEDMERFILKLKDIMSTAKLSK